MVEPSHPGSFIHASCDAYNRTHPYKQRREYLNDRLAPCYDNVPLLHSIWNNTHYNWESFIVSHSTCYYTPYWNTDYNWESFIVSRYDSTCYTPYRNTDYNRRKFYRVLNSRFNLSLTLVIKISGKMSFMLKHMKSIKKNTFYQRFWIW